MKAFVIEHCMKKSLSRNILPKDYQPKWYWGDWRQIHAFRKDAVEHVKKLRLAESSGGNLLKFRISIKDVENPPDWWWNQPEQKPLVLSEK